MDLENVANSFGVSALVHLAIDLAIASSAVAPSGFFRLLRCRQQQKRVFPIWILRQMERL
jgi:hypothetical protein